MRISSINRKLTIEEENHLLRVKNSDLNLLVKLQKQELKSHKVELRLKETIESMAKLISKLEPNQIKRASRGLTKTQKNLIIKAIERL